jgi:hypothetical protein
MSMQKTTDLPFHVPLAERMNDVHAVAMKLKDERLKDIRKCVQCNMDLHDGQGVFTYEQPTGSNMYFCSSMCAGEWFISRECVKEIFRENGRGMIP